MISLAVLDIGSNQRRQQAQTIILRGYYPYSQLRNIGCYPLRKCDTGGPCIHCTVIFATIRYIHSLIVVYEDNDNDDYDEDDNYDDIYENFRRIHN